MSFRVDLLLICMSSICVVIVSLMCFQFAWWYNLIVFSGLGCFVSIGVKVALMMLWSDPRSSPTQKSKNFFVIPGEEKIRSFTSCVPVLSFVYVGSSSLSLV